MKKLRFKLIVIAVLVCLCALGIGAVAEPGTDSDPLISKSYVDNVLLPEIQQMIDSSVAGVGGTDSSGNAESERFVVVEVSKGKKVICDAGTELILRMGSATVIATPKGGLADTTSGYDLADGWQMPSNHLLIVPVADGRGVKADTDVIVMIKGGYRIK